MASPSRRSSGPGRAGLPGPGVAEPQGGQDVDPVGRRPGVLHRDPQHQVVRPGLGVGRPPPPSSRCVEDAGVQQLVLRVGLAPAAVLCHQVGVGEGLLGVVVAPAQPGVAGQGVQVPPVVLGVLPVVALAAGEPEHALLEDGVAPVPQGQGQAQALVEVADPGHAVLVPAVGAGAGVVVGEGVPGAAVRGVVLPHRAPGPLGEVGAPRFQGPLSERGPSGAPELARRWCSAVVGVPFITPTAPGSSRSARRR